MKRLRWLLALLVVLGGALAWFWEPDLDLAELKARWAPPPSQFLPLEGMDVHYRDEGQGPVMVLIHGTGSSLHTWDDWAKALSPDHRVIRLDLPGFGLTGPAPDGDYRIARYASFLEAFVQKLGLNRFTLAGNSLGAHIAWSYALDHPERVSALILVDSAGLPDKKNPPLAFRLASLPVISKVLVKVGTRSLVERTVRGVYADPAHISDEVMRRYYELTRRPGNRTSFGQRMRAPYVDRSGELGRLKMPTLIQWGEEDRLIPWAQGEKLHRLIPGSDFTIYPGAGHVPMEEAGTRTVAEVRAWMRLKSIR